MAGSILDGISGNGFRGASTLTMQLLKVLEKKKPGNSSERLWEKIRQIRRARELENNWTKQEILEAYLNLVSFRGEIQGLRAASYSLFQKEPHGLNLKESFFLASLLKSPNVSNSRIVDRLCFFTKERPDLGSCEEIQNFVASLKQSPIFYKNQIAYHLAKKFMHSSADTVKTTLSSTLQYKAKKVLDEQIKNLLSQNVRDGAVVVLENSTGHVIAYVGGSRYSQSPLVDMAAAPRQAGSTLKPFLYAFAFDQKILEPNSWLLDEPFESNTGAGMYHPENYNEEFLGIVQARKALGSSLNIPAVRLLDLLGINSFYQLLRKNGFDGLKDVEYYGNSLALGAADVDLLTLTNAYRTIAKGGVWSGYIMKPEDTALKSHRVFSQKTAKLMGELLADPENRIYTFGWNSILTTPYRAAVKTGTSKDMRDNWCIGFSNLYTVGVWVGNATGEPMWQVSGISGAAPVWRGLMDFLQSGKPISDVGHQPTVLREIDALEASFSKITYPINGAVLAIDPEIPSSKQFVPIEVNGEGEFVFINGRKLESKLWKPVAGNHILELKNEEGVILDKVQFSVKD